MWEKLFDVFKSNLKNPKFYVALLCIFVIILLLFPYIDANVLYYKRIENRLDILKKLVDLDVDKISKNEVLSAEYDRILQEIEKQDSISLGRVLIYKTDPAINRVKFITGALVFWIMAIACLFIKSISRFRDRLVGLMAFGLFGWLLGMLSKVLPTVFSPMVNYIAVPIIEITIIALLATSGNKHNVKKQNASS